MQRTSVQLALDTRNGLGSVPAAVPLAGVCWSCDRSGDRFPRDLPLQGQRDRGAAAQPPDQPGQITEKRIGFDKESAETLAGLSASLLGVVIGIFQTVYWQF